MKKKLRYIAATGIFYVLFVFSFNFFDTWKIIRRVLNRTRSIQSVKVIDVKYCDPGDPLPPPPPIGGGD